MGGTTLGDFDPTVCRPEPWWLGGGRLQGAGQLVVARVGWPGGHFGSHGPTGHPNFLHSPMITTEGDGPM